MKENINLNTMNWKNLRKLEELEQIDELSVSKPVVIFKHSTSCSISGMAFSRLERGVPTINSESDIFYLDLLSHREVSNQIADKYNVEHQSPQILIIKDKKCIFNCSHMEISADRIKKFIEA